MKMVSIEKKKDDDMGLAYSPDEPRYPYGTELCLKDEMINELGVGDLKVGDTVQVMAVARVVRKHESSSESEGGKDHSDKSMDFQLIELGVAPDAGKKDRASTLYGDK